MATDSMGMVTEFAQIGCSEENEGCCPGFPSDENALLTKCPADYFTTADACCPYGWQVYFSSIGSQTPCYTMPSETFVPAMTPTISGITVITEHVFSRKYELTTPKPAGLSRGAKAGLAIGICIAFLALLVFAIFLIRRRRARRQPVPSLTQNMEERPFSPRDQFAPGPQELASPENRSGEWPMNTTSPPAYNQSVSRTSMGKQHPPQELPGSTFIHEHHPAYTGDEAVTAPSSPPASPPASSPRKSTTSPVVSP